MSLLCSLSRLLPFLSWIWEAMLNIDLPPSDGAKAKLGLPI